MSGEDVSGQLFGRVARPRDSYRLLFRRGLWGWLQLWAYMEKSRRRGWSEHLSVGGLSPGPKGRDAGRKGAGVGGPLISLEPLRRSLRCQIWGKNHTAQVGLSSVLGPAQIRCSQHTFVDD